MTHRVTLHRFGSVFSLLAPIKYRRSHSSQNAQSPLSGFTARSNLRLRVDVDRVVGDVTIAVDIDIVIVIVVVDNRHHAAECDVTLWRR